jgi:hypothetical protein
MKTNLRVLAKTERGRKNKKRTGDNHRLAQEQKTLAWEEQSDQRTGSGPKTRSALCTHEKEKSPK